MGSVIAWDVAEVAAMPSDELTTLDRNLRALLERGGDWFMVLMSPGGRISIHVGDEPSLDNLTGHRVR
jgi:hypothetical protein